MKPRRSHEQRVCPHLVSLTDVVETQRRLTAPLDHDPGHCLGVGVTEDVSVRGVGVAGAIEHGKEIVAGVVPAAVMGDLEGVDTKVVGHATRDESIHARFHHLGKSVRAQEHAPALVFGEHHDAAAVGDRAVANERQRGEGVHVRRITPENIEVNALACSQLREPLSLRLPLRLRRIQSGRREDTMPFFS